MSDSKSLYPEKRIEKKEIETFGDSSS